MIQRRLTGRAARALTALLWTGAVVFAAWIASSLITRLTAPAPLAAAYQPVSDPRLAAQRLAIKHPMAGNGEATVAGTPRSPAAATGFSLIGVATGFGNAPGFALLKPSGGAVAPYMVGETLAPGVVLTGLYPEHVEIERNGLRERIALDRNAAAAARAAAGTPSMPGAVRYNPAAPAPANLR